MMAAVCVACRMPPRDYWTLTVDEESAIVRAINEANQARDRGDG